MSRFVNMRPRVQMKYKSCQENAQRVKRRALTGGLHLVLERLRYRGYGFSFGARDVLPLRLFIIAKQAS